MEASVQKTSLSGATFGSTMLPAVNLYLSLGTNRAQKLQAVSKLKGLGQKKTKLYHRTNFLVEISLSQVMNHIPNISIVAEIRIHKTIK